MSKTIILVLVLILTPLLCIANPSLYPIKDKNMIIMEAVFDDDCEFIGFRTYHGENKLPKIKCGVNRPINISTNQQMADFRYNQILDSLGIINWNCDTLSIISSDYENICFSITDVIKTTNKTIVLSAYYDDISDQNVFKTSNFEDYLNFTPIIASNRIKYNTLLSWDINKIHQLLHWSYGPFINRYTPVFYYIYHIIIKDGKIQSIKMIIIPEHFIWRLGPDDFPGQKQIDYMKERERKNKKQTRR